jgi:hypothetical protein
MNASKARLLAELEANGIEAARKLRALDPERFHSGVYENGWNGRQVLAHIASIEWTYGRLIELAASSPASASDARRERAASGRDGMDGYNQRQVAKRAGIPVEDLIAEFESNRARTIAAVAAAHESLFDVPIRSLGGRTGTLAKVLREVAVEHVAGHTADITG